MQIGGSKFITFHYYLFTSNEDILVRRCHLRRKGNPSLLARRESHGNDVVSAQRRDHLPLIADAIHLVAYHRTGVVQIQ